MADKYWRGGTAAWDGTAGSKWADSSSGPTGAAVPTTADDVYFDATSTGICTISTGNTGAKTINCTGFTGTLTGTAAISVAGSITLVAGMTYTHTGTVTFINTGTLTTAGKAFSAVTINGSGITLTLGDALNISTRSITVTQGTFDTGNYSVIAGSLVASSSSTKTITLGSSTLNISGAASWNLSGSNTTLNAGTSQINFTTVGAMLGGGKTYYNVSFTGTAASTSGTSNRRLISGSNTFNNLTFAAPTSGMASYILTDDQVVNSTLTCSGTSAIGRCFVYTGTGGLTSTIGTTRTITAAIILANDCDFRDITIAGDAAGTSPTRAGDCGGNTGIVFPVAKTVYRVGTNTTWVGSSSWSLTSGTAGSNTNFPLAQDTIIINQDTTLTGTLALAFFNNGTLDLSSRTSAITLNHNVGTLWYGSYILGSGVTISGTTTQTFCGRGTIYFTSAGKTITFAIIVDAPGGTLILGDAFNGNGSLSHFQGTINANDYNLTCTIFSSSSSSALRTITMGAGLWTLTGTGTVWSAVVTNLTFNKNTANILLSNTTTTARTFAGQGLSYNKLTIGGASGVSVLTISGINSFTELASTKTVAHTIRFSANQNTIDTWSVAGTSGNIVTVDSSSSGTRRTFTLTNITTGIDYLSVKDIGCNNANRFYVGSNSIDGGNNNNVIFTDPPSATPTGNMFIMF